MQNTFLGATAFGSHRQFLLEPYFQSMLHRSIFIYLLRMLGY